MTEKTLTQIYQERGCVLHYDDLCNAFDNLAAKVNKVIERVEALESSHFNMGGKEFVPTRLRNCPICGANNPLLFVSTDSYAVQCGECRFGIHKFERKEDAYKAWNNVICRGKK